MKQKILIPIAIFVVFILFLFLGKTITGLVISQSCCYPPNCDEEHICEDAGPMEQKPMKLTETNTLILAGSIAFLAFLLIY